jgi:RHS repeat-associated protein
LYHYHLDHLGTPQEITNAQGQVVWAPQYKAYGNLALKPAASPQLQADAAQADPLRFQGQYFDEETGLHYNRHRYYDPNCGQFITQDPIGLLGGLNCYQYVPNPVGWVDPLGLTAKSDDCLKPDQRFETRRQAMGAAKRDAGVPRNQRPDDVKQVPMTDRNGHQIMDENHQPLMTREYHYTKEDGSRIVIQDHGAGHQQFVGEAASEPHLNVRPYDPITGNASRTGKVPGTSGHYVFGG